LRIPDSTRLLQLDVCLHLSTSSISFVAMLVLLLVKASFNVKRWMPHVDHPNALSHEYVGRAYFWRLVERLMYVILRDLAQIRCPLAVK